MQCWRMTEWYNMKRMFERGKNERMQREIAFSSFHWFMSISTHVSSDLFSLLLCLHPALHFWICLISCLLQTLQQNTSSTRAAIRMLPDRKPNACPGSVRYRGWMLKFKNLSMKTSTKDWNSSAGKSTREAIFLSQRSWDREEGGIICSQISCSRALTWIMNM